MPLTRFVAYISFFSLIGGLCSCKKESPKGEMQQGMISLSFDDTYINNWYKNLSLLDSLGIKATFYISSYHSLNLQQKNKLRIIENHGNEIAYHTTNHKDLLKLNRSDGITAIVEREIDPDLKLMRTDGFNPVDFAYPFGQHDQYLDRQLLPLFKSVRGVSNPNYYTCFARHTGAKQVFNAIEIDSRSKLIDERIQNLMRLAWENNNCTFFYAHAINDPSINLQVTADRLRFMASIAQMYNLRFIKVSEISY